MERISDELVINGPRTATVSIVLAHGAGAGMDSEFLNTFAIGIAQHGFRVVRFEFPYMAERRESGRRKPPDREPILRDTWMRVIQSVETGKLIIGGKSLGGRIASLLADEVAAAGLLCLGYPFHPSGKPEQQRVEHLKTIRTPTLIVQGERDSLGNKDEVARYELSASIRIRWLPDGDHSFKPRKASGLTQAENLREGIEAVAKFVRAI